MATTGEKRTPQEAFVNIQTTEVKHEGCSVPAYSSEVQSGQPVQSVVNDLADRWWLWETVAWSASLVGLIGVFALLSHIKEKPVPNWVVRNSRIDSVELRVTINSVISILATLVKSSLLVPLAAALGQQKWLWFQGGAQKLSDFQQFDAANKGPLGSFILIWSLRGRRLACLGALIVIAALGLDFSFQQLVTYPVVARRAENAAASIPVATATDKYYVIIDIAGGNLKRVANIDPSMLSAVYAGLFANGHADQLSVSPDCTTGNCTWASPYTTLGVCSKCYDITSSIQQQCIEYDSDLSTTRNSENGVNGSIQYKDINCTYSLPNGLNITNEVSGTTFKVLGSVGTRAGQSVHFSNLQNPLAIMYLLNTTMDFLDPRLVKPVLNSSFAAECALEYCVKKYEGSVSLGKINETLIDTFFNETAEFDNGAKIEGDEGSTGYFDSYLSIQPPASWLADTINANSSSFTVGYSIHTSLEYIFTSSDTCDDTISGEAVPDCPYTIFDGKVTGYSDGTMNSLHDIPRRIYSLNFTGVETMMDNIAHGLTSAIRTSKSAIFPTANAPLQGEARHNVVIAHVRWGWLAVPATLLVLTLVFMLLTAWETRRRKAMLWKGSSLPAFYYPLTKDGRSQLTDVASPRVLENTASTMKVKCQMTESGIRMVKVD